MHGCRLVTSKATPYDITRPHSKDLELWGASDLATLIYIVKMYITPFGCEC